MNKRKGAPAGASGHLLVPRDQSHLFPVPQRPHRWPLKAPGLMLGDPLSVFNSSQAEAPMLKR